MAATEIVVKEPNTPMDLPNFQRSSKISLIEPPPHLTQTFESSSGPAKRTKMT